MTSGASAPGPARVVAALVVAAAAAPAQNPSPASVGEAPLDPSLAAAGDRRELFGASVAGVGDVNGDGVPDVAVGDPDGGGASAGGRILLFGANGALVTEIRGARGFGHGIERADDLDGDGSADLLVVRFVDERAPSSILAVSLPEGRVLYELSLGPIGCLLGWQDFGCGPRLAPLADVDGDGTGDFAVGAPSAGRGAPAAGEVTLHSGASGAELLRLEGRSPGQRFGAALVAIEAPRLLAVSTAPLDGSTPAAPTVTIFALPDGREVATLRAPPDAGPTWGWSLAALRRASGSAADARLVVGAPFGGEEPALSFYALPSGAPLGARSVDAELSRGGFGATMAAVADLDGDRWEDLLVAAPRAWWRDDAVQLLAGQRGRLAATRIQGTNVGLAMDVVGDVNGDGAPELVVGGAMRRSSFPGGAFVVDGRTLDVRVRLAPPPRPPPDRDAARDE